MLSMDHIAEIRRRHFISGENISEIARSLNLSRPTVRKALQVETEPVYQRQVQPTPKLGGFKAQLTDWLVFDSKLPKRRRRTAQRLFECLQVEGYQGSYGPVQRFVLDWKRESGKQPVAKQAFVPLIFPAGETCQFGWSYEYIVLGGVLQTIKAAHFRLSYSRKMFLVAYPRETQEMVLDAHIRAFSYFGGVPKRIIYDNLKTVVDAIFVGKDRQFNRRFLTLANHYLFEPVACTPESGWEKGQVENQVGNVREWLFTPTPRFAGFAELNAWLVLRCQELANRYSVPADWANRVVSVRLTADRLRLVADGQVIAEHDRCYGRSQLLCDPWHYLPVLEKNPCSIGTGCLSHSTGQARPFL